jgi:GDPmannose 4,6-dehydratase
MTDSLAVRTNEKSIESPVVKVAFITGISGQDGSYLAEHLLSLGYSVHGLIRRKSQEDPSGGNLKAIRSQVTLHYGDLSDRSSLNRILSVVQPDEIYNLAAMSFVGTSFQSPDYTFQVNTQGVINLLEELRILNTKKQVKFYQASTSEMFGGTPPPQHEKSPFYPKSPYGVSKVAAYWAAINYRESYKLFIVNGILFNHESPRRGSEFVTRKITLGIANYLATGKVLELGNIDAVRDWGHSRDYVKAQHLLLQQSQADDFVIGTGIGTKVRDFVTMICQLAKIPLIWEGKGVDEVGKTTDGKVVVKVSKELFRPAEVDTLIADTTKFKKLCGWQPATTVLQLATEMIKQDCATMGIKIDL